MLPLRKVWQIHPDEGNHSCLFFHPRKIPSLPPFSFAPFLFFCCFLQLESNSLPPYNPVLDDVPIVSVGWSPSCLLYHFYSLSCLVLKSLLLLCLASVCSFLFSIVAYFFHLLCAQHQPLQYLYLAPHDTHSATEGRPLSRPDRSFLQGKRRRKQPRKSWTREVSGKEKRKMYWLSCF